jgi:putative peptidoglycan lipid II flippase
VKLFASAFYALGDTRTPVRIAALSVALSAALAALAMQVLGAAGIALGAALAAWVNVTLLVRALGRRTGPIPPATRALVAVLAGALGATAGGLLVQWRIAGLVGGLAALAVFALAYLGVTAALGHPEAVRLTRRGGGPTETR